jgi:uridine phosphorylase
MIANNNRAGEVLAPSELILNEDGSIFHLKLYPHQIAHDIIVVGDQNRVELISSFFDKIEVQVSNREFCTHTGWYNEKRITAVSSGIGVDNIDIVINELDALVNIDLETRKVKETITSLNIVRIGTCGALQPEIEPGEFILSQYGFGMDGMLNYYTLDFEEEEIELSRALTSHLKMDEFGITPYLAKADQSLVDKIGEGMHHGITATASGFYAPQGRALRLKVALPEQNDLLETFIFKGKKVQNFEMETSAIFGLGGALSHKCCTVCVAVANRPLKKALTSYKPKIQELIGVVLGRLTS